jgi:AcrR family transcriptional regulator
MGRKENKERPGQLLEAMLQYLLAHGLSDLSLRPLARAVGSSPRVLLYYFGSKERLVAQVLREFRRRQQTLLDRTPETASFEDSCREIWRAMSSPESESLFRLFFEACGLALRRPRQFEEFRLTAVEDWLAYVADPLCQDGCGREQSRAFATLVLDGFRGFMLDLCVTGERERVNRAVGLWLLSLDPVLARVRGGARA